MRAVLDSVAADVDTLATQVTDTLCQELVAYQTVPPEQLVPGIRASMCSGLAAVRDRRPPSAKELTEIAQVARTRAQQGLSLETVLGAYRMGTRATWAVAAQRGRRAGVPAEILLEFTDRTWEWVDAITAHAAAAHRHAELALARYDHQQLADFVIGAIRGTLPPPDLHERAASYGLNPHGAYGALRARATPPSTTYDLERQLMSAPQETQFLTVEDGDLVGILDVVQFTEVHAGIVAVGPFGPLEALAESHRVASAVFLTAERLGLHGVHRLEQLRLVTAVASDESLAQLCEQRVLHPLERSRVGEKDLLDTLRAFTSHGLNVERAARALVVHPNTVCYRLERIENLTGLNLGHLDDLVEVWWVLQARRMGSPPRR